MIKPTYNSKPSLKDYDTAFEISLVTSSRGLKQLICSPMVYVREGIPLEHFATKLFQFRKRTAAEDQVITGGLSYSDFLKSMEECFVCQAEETTLPQFQIPTLNGYDPETDLHSPSLDL
ncbi:hypothetical protein J6590_014967 [Homalodisca vitripennis]|nr:hypothetical protein J6590_014967 [Homalodisca vitripennis]